MTDLYNMASVYFFFYFLQFSVMLPGLTLANDITDIKLYTVSNNTILRSGTVLVNYRNEWANICIYGDQKNWGKREADTACKQLQYRGGWPYDVNNDDGNVGGSLLNNFDCDEYVSDLTDCEFDVINACGDSKLAGIQCYDDFEVELTGNESPNSGRVEVKYDNQSASVCYEPQNTYSKVWSFANVQVLCRQLGFPGAMIAGRGGQGNGTHDVIIAGYQCREDLREVSLEDCDPDSPQPAVNDSNSSCGFENEAAAICAVPGYLGCYNMDKTVSTTMEVRGNSSRMTINWCRHFCKDNYCKFAFLYNGSTCLCSSIIPTTQQGDEMCRAQCSGDVLQVCGDMMTLSVYDGQIGVCNDPLNVNGTRKYFFNDLFDDFCVKGMTPINATVIRCTFGENSNEFAWNDTYRPQCVPHGIVAGTKIGITIGFLSLVVVICLLVAAYCWQRHKGTVPVLTYTYNTIDKERIRADEGFRAVFVEGSQTAAFVNKRLINTRQAFEDQRPLFHHTRVMEMFQEIFSAEKNVTLAKETSVSDQELEKITAEQSQPEALQSKHIHKGLIQKKLKGAEVQDSTSDVPQTTENGREPSVTAFVITQPREVLVCSSEIEDTVGKRRKLDKTKSKDGYVMVPSDDAE